MGPAGNIVLLGFGATLTLDVWAFVRRALFRTPLPDYGLVGRWIAGLARGRVRHARISAAPAVPGELPMGWLAHYLIGIAFGGLLIAIQGNPWLQQPSIGPALWVGIGTLALPFFVMQPAMGAGFAASRSPRPVAARLQSVVSHAVFGLGLYLSAQFMACWT